jgi:hypothetical protein
LHHNLIHNQQTNIFHMEFQFIFLAVIAVLAIISVLVSVSPPIASVSEDDGGEDSIDNKEELA